MAARYNALQGDATKKQHQLWFLKRSESNADQAKIKADSERAINDLESRTADLRHIEAELETVRQAHYGAGDQVNQAQGKLYEASAEVGRLEGEIRFVVEGRQRVEQRLVQLREQMGQWGRRREEAEAEIETLAGAGVDAEEQAIMLAAQLEEHDARMPDLEEAVQRAQDEANTQRTTVSQVQQQIQVLAADQRNIEEQSRQLTMRSERLRADQNALAAPDEARLLDMQEQHAMARNEPPSTQRMMSAGTSAVSQLPRLPARAWLSTVATKMPAMMGVGRLKRAASKRASSWVLSPISARATKPVENRKASMMKISRGPDVP